MNAGYGRGYYGVGQLAPRPPRTSAWVKLAVVVGAGAVIWLLWPRSQARSLEAGIGDDVPKAPPNSPDVAVLRLEAPVESMVSVATVPPALTSTALVVATPRLEQAALVRGYSSQQAYEDAVVAGARQLQRDGATVMFPPHLQHLSARLGS